VHHAVASACLAVQCAYVSLVCGSSSLRPSMAVTEHQINGIACTSCYADCRCYSSSEVSEKGCVWCCQGRSHPRWSHSSEGTKRSPHSRPPHWPHYQHRFTLCIYTPKLVSLPSEVTRPETHGGVVQRVKVREYRTCCHGVLPGAICRASAEVCHLFWEFF
jgi:hypothetical protein